MATATLARERTGTATVLTAVPTTLGTLGLDLAAMTTDEPQAAPHHLVDETEVQLDAVEEEHEALDDAADEPVDAKTVSEGSYGPCSRTRRCPSWTSSTVRPCG